MSVDEFACSRGVGVVKCWCDESKFFRDDDGDRGRVQNCTTIGSGEYGQRLYRREEHHVPAPNTLVVRAGEDDQYLKRMDVGLEK